MKSSLRIALSSVALLLVATLLAPATLAQAPNNPQQKPDPNAKYARLKYDKAAEVTVVGVVDEVQEFECPVSNAMGSHLILRTAEGRILIHVAPVNFLKQYGIVLKKGDKLSVTGAKMKDGEGGDTMIAREIVSNELVVAVRTPDGKPLW
jgi:hypothetical protein